MTDQEEAIRIEAFAHAFAFGYPVKEALRQAGYERTSATFGMTLLKRADVQAIIESDREWMRTKMVASLDSIAAQLDRDREFAYECENPSAAIQASMHKAKLLGFMDNNDKNMPKKITIVWEDEDE